MAPPTPFRCRECGANESRGWQNYCARCGAGPGTLVPHGYPLPCRVRARTAPSEADLLAPALGDESFEDVPRVRTGMAGIDRLFGGGLPRGKVVLLAGAPGAGKSTLLLQLVESVWGCAVYATAEETRAAVGARANRLELPNRRHIRVIESEDLSAVCAGIRAARARLAVIDSLQAVRMPDGIDDDGNVLFKAQTEPVIRDIANEIRRFSAEQDVATVLVCQLVKADVLAGMRNIEHMADTVLWFTGDPTKPLRELGATKNRYGATTERACFHMTPKGLVPVDPADLEPDTRPVADAGMAAPERGEAAPTRPDDAPAPAKRRRAARA